MNLVDVQEVFIDVDRFGYLKESSYRLHDEVDAAIISVRSARFVESQRIFLDSVLCPAPENRLLPVVGFQNGERDNLKYAGINRRLQLRLDKGDGICSGLRC